MSIQCASRDVVRVLDISRRHNHPLTAAAVLRFEAQRYRQAEEVATAEMLYEEANSLEADFDPGVIDRRHPASD